MNILYALGGYLFNVILLVVSLYNPKVRRILKGRRETTQRLEAKLDPQRPTLWLHASSLGEFEQGRPLLERVREIYPNYQILLSFYSPSGYEVRQSYAGADCVVYFPSDTPRAVRSFLDAAQPDLVVFVKYDFWPNMLKALAERSIPTYLISAIFRPQQLFFKPWGGMYLRLLHLFSHLFVQDEASQTLLEKHGINAVSIAGDSRFDRVESIAQASSTIPEIEEMKSDGSLLLIAGSTWPVEHGYLAEYAGLHPELKMIIAPHEFNDDTLSRLRLDLGKQMARLSEVRQSKRNTANIRYLVIDSFGLLSSVYRYADIAYIGGGFGRGIHNTIEAAVYGVPVVFGAKYQKFREAKLLLQHQAGYTVASREELFACLDQLLLSEQLRTSSGVAARRVVESQLGATAIILKELDLSHV